MCGCRPTRKMSLSDQAPGQAKVKLGQLACDIAKTPVLIENLWLTQQEKMYEPVLRRENSRADTSCGTTLEKCEVAAR